MTPDSSSSAQPAAKVPLTVSPELEQKYPELLALLRASESMNDEERQYWANILPAMTGEQVQNLFEILKNERDQLAAIDAKYAKAIEKVAERPLEDIEKERQQRLAARKQSEAKHLEEEAGATDALLKQIEQ